MTRMTTGLTKMTKTTNKSHTPTKTIVAVKTSDGKDGKDGKDGNDDADREEKDEDEDEDQEDDTKDTKQDKHPSKSSPTRDKKKKSSRRQSRVNVSSSSSSKSQDRLDHQLLDQAIKEVKEVKEVKKTKSSNSHSVDDLTSLLPSHEKEELIHQLFLQVYQEVTRGDDDQKDITDVIDEMSVHPTLKREAEALLGWKSDDLKAHLRRLLLYTLQEDAMCFVERRLLRHRARLMILGRTKEEMIREIQRDQDANFRRALLVLFGTEEVAERRILSTIETWCGMSKKESEELTMIAWMNEMKAARRAFTNGITIDALFTEMTQPEVFALTALLYRWMPEQHEQAVRQFLCKILKPTIACVKCLHEVPGTPVRCTHCELTFYCNRECQLSDWSTHSKQCRP